MPSVVPSQICSFIDSEFQYISRDKTPQSQNIGLSGTTICLTAGTHFISRATPQLAPSGRTNRFWGSRFQHRDNSLR